jgi:hypothetical protein
VPLIARARSNSAPPRPCVEQNGSSGTCYFVVISRPHLLATQPGTEDAIRDIKQDKMVFDLKFFL